MGIVNVTPDSFSDGGRYRDAARAIEHGLRLAEEGADLVDLGGESTRPGAEPVAVQEELDRVMPVLEGLVRAGVAVSVDTVKPEVMHAAVAGGCRVVNDVNAFRSQGAVEAVAGSHGVGVVAMHMRGTPRTMQEAPAYGNVVEEVCGFLRQRAGELEAAGIGRERIALDPGFGFGKTYEHNRQLFRALPALAATGYAVLVGVSRKRMIGEATGRALEGRLAGSVAAAMLAVQGGARIVRVHDVKETVDALAVLHAFGAREGGT